MFESLFVCILKESKYDQETPQSPPADQPMHSEVGTQNINSHKIMKKTKEFRCEISFKVICEKVKFSNCDHCISFYVYKLTYIFIIPKTNFTMFKPRAKGR